MKNQNFYMRVISLLLVVLAVLFYNSSMKAQANEKEISALTDKVDTLQEQQNELLSALETSYANRMQNQAASTGTDSSNADSTDGDKAADTSDGKTSDANAEDTAAPDSDNVYKDGTYTGEADGYGGTIQVEMTLASDEITSINVEGKAGAKYTRAKRPVKLVYYEGFATKEEAMSREYRIKQLTKEKKLELMKF